VLLVRLALLGSLVARPASMRRYPRDSFLSTSTSRRSTATATSPRAELDTPSNALVPLVAALHRDLEPLALVVGRLLGRRLGRLEARAHALCVALAGGLGVFLRLQRFVRARREVGRVC
jgi:hypothetical protein